MQTDHLLCMCGGNNISAAVYSGGLAIHYTYVQPRERYVYRIVRLEALYCCLQNHTQRA